MGVTRSTEVVLVAVFGKDNTSKESNVRPTRYVKLAQRYLKDYHQ